MKKFILLFIIIFFNAYLNLINAQVKDIKSRATEIFNLMSSGDYVKAEKCLRQLPDSEDSIPKAYRVFIFNSFGLTSQYWGRYDDALKYYQLAERSVLTRSDSIESLGGIYVNEAIIYGYKKSYRIAIEYFERGIRIYSGVKNADRRITGFVSTSYLNFGIVLFEIGEFNTALSYLEKGKALKSKENMPEIALFDLNIAKVNVKLSRYKEAEKFFKESIKIFKDNFGPEYSRLSEVYFECGQFLFRSGRYSESLDILERALSICRKNYGGKHSLTSYSYKLIGDYYANRSVYDSALVCYQESLVSIVPGFNDTDIYRNPSADSSLYDIRLLETLKSKAAVLELLAGTRKNNPYSLKALNAGMNTNDLALKVIDRIRNGYPDEQSRIYIAENEKETWLSSIRIAGSLYSLDHDPSLSKKMYSIAQRAKASVLQNEITENDLLYSSYVSDPLRKKLNTISKDIALYNKLLRDESEKKSPDSSRVSMWKDELFGMNRGKDSLMAEINIIFPQYHDRQMKTEPLSPSIIQKELGSNETIIDYILSNQYAGGKRTLYIFLVSGKAINFLATSVDSLFSKNAEIIRSGDNPQSSSDDRNIFTSYTGALYYMYNTLIRPVEKIIKGKRLIIIPDEEIAWLPFDAFLRSEPFSGQSDYEGLQYLVKDYTFSYGYSSSLVFNISHGLKKGEEVYAFSPDYGNGTPDGKSPGKLNGADEEIGSIFKWFGGRKFTGSEATLANFRSMGKDSAIIHLAMHSVYDTLNSEFSYLLFDSQPGTGNEGRLYNYDISLARIKSPMVVLSACNSGTGTLYHGEGLMSLARGFILAGASSVVKTSWEVNDNTSAKIIDRFYYYLSKGNRKDEAMRRAKLDYIKGTSPAYANPYYWAAYEVTGDSSPVAHKKGAIVIIVSLILILGTGLLCLYLRRRSIFSDGPA